MKGDFRMQKEALVLSINGDFAKVLVKRDSACGDSCASCSMKCNHTSTVSALNCVGAKPNDLVIIKTDTKIVLKSAFLAYILPLITFFVSYFLSFFITNNESVSFITGAIFFLFTFIFLYFKDKSTQNKNIVKIIKIIKKESYI